MKFGQRIKDARYSEWADNYLDYSALKKVLKSTSPWTDVAESDFIHKLQLELEKCETFQKTKADQVTGEIDKLEKEVLDLVAKVDAEERDAEEQGEGRTDRTEGDDAGSDDDDDDEDDDDRSEDGSNSSYNDRFRDLEESVANLVADVHDLALFTKLNFTGFIKIVKKHDKVTGFSLKPTFNKDFLEKHPFYKINYDPVIVKLSKLFDLVRTRGHPIAGDSSAGGSQNAFVRSTTKYWVHDDNIVPLKLAIMKNLPVLVFDSKKAFEPKDAAITSIYFDNEDLELYLGRLEKTEGAEAIRMRWYGDVDKKDIFVERKTHREDWTGEKSVKERFIIKEDKLNDYLAGRHLMDDEFDKLVKLGKKTEKDVENMKDLAAEIQYAVVTRQLKPVVRTFYNRTAFQLPGNATVRISLDTELTMVREDNFDGKDRTGGNWRRKDVGIDHPFANIEKSEKELFPYAVLEVKLSVRQGEEAPQWIRDLIASHLVEAVPKFSKFIHGCATLLPERVDLVPFWLPQMDKDIRKPVSARSRVLIERPNTSNHSPASAATSAPDSPSPANPAYHEPVSEGEDDEEYLKHAADDEETMLRLPPDMAAQARAAKEFRENKIREDAAAAAPADAQPGTSSFTRFQQKYSNGLRIDPLAGSSGFDQKLADSMKKLQKHKRKDDDSEDEEDEEEEDPNAVIYVNEFHAPAGKKISIPIRIEPKVVFAAERTFLKWSHFAVLLAGVAIGLINFIPAEDTVGLFAAGCFTFTALAAIAYSAGMYAYRILKLRKRQAVSYHDKWGPTFLCASLMASVLVNLLLRLREL